MASSDWSHVVTGPRRTVVGLLAVWVVGVIALYVIGRRQDDPTTLKAALCLPPDVLRLLRRLAADHPATRRSRQADAVDRIPDFHDRLPDFTPSWDTPTTRSWWPLPCARSSTRPARTAWRTTAQAARKGCGPSSGSPASPPDPAV